MDDRIGVGDVVYPATYRAPMWDRIKPGLIVIPMFIFTMAGRGRLFSISSVWIFVAVVLGFFAVIGDVLSTSFCMVTLYRDRIERRSLFGTKIMRRNDVGKIAMRQFGLVLLTYKYNSGDGMMLPRNIGGDDAWNAWMDQSRKL